MQTTTKLQEIVSGSLYAMDINFAREFAIVTRRPETEALSVLRNLIAQRLQEFSGRDKYERSVRSSCDSMLTWYQTSGEYAIADLIGFVASHQHACVYAVLVGRAVSTEVR